MKVPKEVMITALVVLGAMQIGAMYFGVNGTFRAYTLMIIGAICGLALPQLKTK